MLLLSNMAATTLDETLHPTPVEAATCTFGSLPKPPTRTFLPLDQLADSWGHYSKGDFNCPDDLVYVNDTVLDPALAWAGGRKIPRIVHLSSKSRCNDPILAGNIEKWRLAGHSVCLHNDDEAIQRLFHRGWPWALTIAPPVLWVCATINANTLRVSFPNFGTMAKRIKFTKRRA